VFIVSIFTKTAEIVICTLYNVFLIMLSCHNLSRLSVYATEVLGLNCLAIL